MNRVIALAWAVEPLDLSDFFPPQVTVPVGTAALLPEALPIAEDTAPLVIAPLLLIAEDAAPLVIAELLAPPPLLAIAELEVTGAAAEVLLAELDVLLLLGAALLLLPQADSTTAAAAMRLTAAADRLSFT